MASDLNNKLNNEYSRLCAQLGDLEYKLKILSSERDQIVERIKLLSTMVEKEPLVAPELSKNG
jgi:hypothetical protein